MRTIILGGPSNYTTVTFAVKAKIYDVIYSQSSSIAFDETSSYWSAQKAPNFSAFHWSPHGSLVSIDQHFETTRVVHLPKRTETSLITESDRSGPNHRIGPDIAAIAGYTTVTFLVGRTVDSMGFGRENSIVIYTVLKMQGIVTLKRQSRLQQTTFINIFY